MVVVVAVTTVAGSAIQKTERGQREQRHKERERKLAARLPTVRANFALLPSGVCGRFWPAVRFSSPAGAPLVEPVAASAVAPTKRKTAIKSIGDKSNQLEINQ